MDKSREGFLNRNPHLTDFMFLLDSLKQESPRGAVLISMSFMEDQLGEILKSFMLEHEVAQEVLEGHNAPLQALAARNSLCFALGLISEEEFRECNRLRKIRNEFAHKHRTTFDDRRIIDLCSALEFSADEYVAPSGELVTVDARGQFMTSSVALIVTWTTRASEVATQRRSMAKWLKQVTYTAHKK